MCARLLSMCLAMQTCENDGIALVKLEPVNADVNASFAHFASY